jgi:hypothetical protein
MIIKTILRDIFGHLFGLRLTVIPSKIFGPERSVKSVPPAIAGGS